MPRRIIELDARMDAKLILSRNLRLLRDHHPRDWKWSYKEIARRSGGRVSAKTVGNMINEVGDTRIDNVDAIASVFGLRAWHLLMPHLFSDATSETNVVRLYNAYIQATPDGRRHIERVAEREAEFQNAAKSGEKISPSSNGNSPLSAS